MVSETTQCVFPAAHEFLIISASVGGKLRRMMGQSTSPVIQSSQGMLSQDDSVGPFLKLSATSGNSVAVLA